MSHLSRVNRVKVRYIAKETQSMSEICPYCSEDCSEPNCPGDWMRAMQEDIECLQAENEKQRAEIEQLRGLLSKAKFVIPKFIPGCTCESCAPAQALKDAIDELSETTKNTESLQNGVGIVSADETIGDPDYPGQS